MASRHNPAIAYGNLRRRIPPVITTASSAVESTTLLTGSGEAFARRRVPIFATWVVALAVPAISAAITDHSGETDPSELKVRAIAPIGRMKVWTASQSESTPGILSATSSMQYMEAEIPMTQGFASASRPWSLSWTWRKSHRMAAPAMQVAR